MLPSVMQCHTQQLGKGRQFWLLGMEIFFSSWSGQTPSQTDSPGGGGWVGEPTFALRIHFLMFSQASHQKSAFSSKSSMRTHGLMAQAQGFKPGTLLFNLSSSTDLQGSCFYWFRPHFLIPKGINTRASISPPRGSLYVVVNIFL